MVVTAVACSNTPTSPSSVNVPVSSSLDAGSASPVEQYITTFGPANHNGGSPGSAGIASWSGADFAAGNGNFATNAATLHIAHIEWGRLANNLGEHWRVKWFGRQMVQEHTSRLANLREIASSQVPGSMALSGAQHLVANQLSSVSGHEFDRLYTQLMLHELEGMMAYFQRPSISGSGATDLNNHAADFAERLNSDYWILRDHRRSGSLAHPRGAAALMAPFPMTPSRWTAIEPMDGAGRILINGVRCHPSLDREYFAR